MHDLIAALEAAGYSSEALCDERAVLDALGVPYSRGSVILATALLELRKIHVYERSRRTRAVIAATSAEMRDARLVAARKFVDDHPSASLSRVALHVANGAKKSTVEKYLRRNLDKWRPKNNRDTASLSRSTCATFASGNSHGGEHEAETFPASTTEPGQVVP